MEIWKKNWKCGKNLEIGKRFGNLEKIRNLEKRLEIWKKDWKFGKKLKKKLELWKIILKFEKNMKNFEI